MRRRNLTPWLAAALALSLATLARAWRLPGSNEGYEPVQPVTFSHRQHAGDMKISCLYCHAGAERSRYAGVPANNICMNCHDFVTATAAAIAKEEAAAKQAHREAERVVSSELRKLYDAVGLDAELQIVEGRAPRPIAWVRVHALPDFAYFDHRAHVTVGCQQCHGAVDAMDRVRQVETLSMGWCVNCHRDVNRTGIGGRPVHASVDCSTCHY